MIESTWGRTSGIIGIVLCAGIGLALGILSCTGAPQAFLVQGGGGVSGDDPPTLTLVEPSQNITRGRGDNFLIRWIDSDRDSNAQIALILVGTSEGAGDIVLVENIPENDSLGVDSFTVNTGTIPVGTYNVMGVIDDGVNDPVRTFAETSGTGASQIVVVTIVETGQGPPTVPPIITVTQPAFDLSVSQDDILVVNAQPTPALPEAGVTAPFDPDSEITMFVLLDTDLNPNNDDPASPDPSQIIVLAQRVIPIGTITTDPFEIRIDLTEIPTRPGGEPYHVRVTVDDATNPRVHEYAVGTINVARLAAGIVDLRDVGRTISGAVWQGFNTGANLGSSFSRVGDFDADGVDDFVMVAQFGNPRNFGQIGEAYLVYGQNQLRFGGKLQVNTIGENISGAIFEAPPVRRQEVLATSNARTDGITDVSFIPDLTGDGRPEIIFGLAHVHGAFDSMDFDPGDDAISFSETTLALQVDLRQGETSVTEGNEAPEVSVGYTGVDDLIISSSTPSTPLGSNAELSWQNTGDSQGEWVLIKFKDVLSIIPDRAENIEVGSIRATLRVRVFVRGPGANVHQCLTDFNEQTTFNTFSVSGGAPVGGTPGTPNIDYLLAQSGGGLAPLDGDTVDFVEADVSEVVQSLLDGELFDSNNELRFILVPDQAEQGLRTSIRSSEFPTVQAERPTLNIDYTRANFAGARGCYPDNLVNNFTDEPDDLEDDTNFYAGGMAVIFNSQNRDNNGVINITRLENTGGVALELVGQRGLILGVVGVERSGGFIFPRVDNFLADDIGDEQAQEDRISGARFVAGPFDFVDAFQLRQGAREGLFGQSVASLGDLNNDGIDEIMISAPRNERYLQDMQNNFGFGGTHFASTRFRGSIVVFPGRNYNLNDQRDKNDAEAGTATTPYLDQHLHGPDFGNCQSPTFPRHQDVPADTFEVFAENIDDFLGGARSAGDFNQDGLDDILCGAPLNDRSSSLVDTGAVYVLYGRNLTGDFDLSNADDPFSRPRMLRIRGETAGDKIGWRQAAGLDVDGDRVDDIFISSPTADFPRASDGGPKKARCGSDLNRDGVVNSADFDAFAFNSCATSGNEILLSSSSCKVFDYNNDGRVDEDDETVFRCLSTTGGSSSCCDNVVDNGFVGIVFGGVTINGDRTISQIGTKDLPGVVFYGAAAGDRAGMDVSSAGDFNQDGFGDILISAPGEARVDRTGEGVRQGVVYLIFGGTHLFNTKWSLAQVGSEELPGIVFLSPFAQGTVDEAAPRTVGLIGDINNDGFGDIAIGNPRADFLDENFPQGPEGNDQEIGRLKDAGDIYIIYGNNFGSNRTTR